MVRLLLTSLFPSNISSCKGWRQSREIGKYQISAWTLIPAVNTCCCDWCSWYVLLKLPSTSPASSLIGPIPLSREAFYYECHFGSSCVVAFVLYLTIRRLRLFHSVCVHGEFIVCSHCQVFSILAQRNSINEVSCFSPSSVIAITLNIFKQCVFPPLPR